MSDNDKDADTPEQEPRSGTISPDANRENVIKLPCRGCIPQCRNYPNCKQRPLWMP